jgi:hypothetical protein
MLSDNEIIGEAIRLVEAGVNVTFPVKGYSMLPFIIGWKESVILCKPSRPEVGDIVLAWVNGSRYVLHRIIRIEGDSVTLMGDGNVSGTEYCSLSDVKARATHVVSADGRKHYLYNKWRMRAAKLWFRLLHVRCYLLWVYKLLNFRIFVLKSNQKRKQNSKIVKS